MRENSELLEGQNHVLELIARGKPLPEVLDSLLAVIQSQCLGMFCSILLLDSDGVHVHHGAARDLPDAFIRGIDGEPIGPRAGSCGTAAFRREPVIVEDIATDPLWEDYRAFALSHGLRACWSTPIFDGNRKVLGTFAMYFSTPGSPNRWHTRLIDISTQIAAIAIASHRKSEALRVSEERLRLALSGGNVDIWEYNIDTAQLGWCGHLNAILNWPANLQGLPLTAFAGAIHPDDRLSVQIAVQDTPTWDSGRDFEFRIIYPDGSLHWLALQGRSERDASGRVVRIRGVALEITERKRAQEEIHRSEAQLMEAQRIACLGSYEWDLRTDTIHRSKEFCRILGLDPDGRESVCDWPDPDALRGRERMTPGVLDEAFAKRRSFDFEEHLMRADGSLRTLHMHGQWKFDEDERPVKLVGICQDITERKQVEQQLRDANFALAKELKKRTRAEKEIQALTTRLIGAQEEERAHLARELHDDLCQQIAALSIAASNLKKDIAPEAVQARSQSENIQQKLIHLSQSVRQLSHSFHPAVLEYSGLGIALQSYCAEFGTLTGMTICFHSEGSFDRVPAPVALCLYRIAQEALQNIRKHAQVEQARLAVIRSAECVSLTVSDDGVGIDPLRKLRSQGIGLVSIKERIRLVNGTVRIESKPRKGTTLIATVPIVI